MGRDGGKVSMGPEGLDRAGGHMALEMCFCHRLGHFQVTEVVNVMCVSMQ